MINTPCPNLNHRVTSPPVRFCPNCGMVVNQRIRAKECSELLCRSKEEAIRLARKHLSDDLPRQYDVIYGAEEQKFQVDEIVIFVGRFAPKTTPQTGK